MTDQLTTELLRERLTAHVDGINTPAADLDAVRRRSRALRARRLAAPGLLAAAAVGVGAIVLTQSGPAPYGEDDAQRYTAVAAEGRLDLSHGLRGFAAPSERLYLGGTSIKLTSDIDYLDTDAVATPYGLVYTDPQGRVQLIGESGTSEPLSGPSDMPAGWHPTVKADGARPQVVWASLDGADVTITVYDLETRSAVARTDVTCGLVHPGTGAGDEGDCSALVIDAIDSGAVFLRAPDGTKVWDYDTGEWFGLAGPRTRIADVRDKVVLYDGPAPSGLMDGWRFVPGAIDAQLTLDGQHVLYWSDELEPTLPGRDPIELDLPMAATFFTVDTDGSVLAATSGTPSRVFDCEIPDGPCEEIGKMSTAHGDPTFIGNDM